MASPEGYPKLRVMLTCERCGAMAVVTSRIGPLLQVHVYSGILAELQDDGWRRLHGVKEHRCPECVTSEPANSVCTLL